MMAGLLLAGGLYGASRLGALPRLLADWRAFQAWRAEQAAFDSSTAPPVTPEPMLQSTPLAGACYALAQPPAHLQTTLSWLARNDADDSYAFPIGWYRNKHAEASLCRGAFVGDTNHILISGMSDSGKDNLALNMLLTLALRNSPERLQVGVIDGKGLDFNRWQDRAHTWRLALKPEEIRPAMEALSAERERRRDVLAAVGVSKWETYPGHDLPLLVIYISELSLLEDAVGGRELGQWLNGELAAGRAFGIRYIIATQTASNYATRWRSQIGLYLAGFQPSESQDAPNTGLTTRELHSHQALPPSKLPAPPAGAGVFTAVHGRECITVRASYLSDEQRSAWLQRLPAAPPVVEAATTPELVPEDAVSASHSAITPLLPATTTRTIPDATHVDKAHAEQEKVVVAPPADVPLAEREKILALKRQGLSSRKIELEVYGFVGGRAYACVNKVLTWARSNEPVMRAA
jgi:hypothetical protein